MEPAKISRQVRRRMERKIAKAAASKQRQAAIATRRNRKGPKS